MDFANWDFVTHFLSEGILQCLSEHDLLASAWHVQEEISSPRKRTNADRHDASSENAINSNGEKSSPIQDDDPTTSGHGCLVHQQKKRKVSGKEEEAGTCGEVLTLNNLTN